jgi:hypothetical protein
MKPEHLAYWIHERESVREKKEAGCPKPWSEDPIFQGTYFCNVRREDDKVTKWIRENWPHHNVGLVVLARMFNLPSHLEQLAPETGDWEGMKSCSKALREAGGKLFNGAYLITTCGVKMDKVDYVYQVAQEASKLNGHVEGLEGFHRMLTSVNGLGDFLAAQVIADLKNTKGHPLQYAQDWWTWAAPGPGSLRGIRCIEGFERTSQGQFLPAMQQLQAQLENEYAIPKIHAQDFQNCLCEFSKYAKVHGGGRDKRNYGGR